MPRSIPTTATTRNITKVRRPAARHHRQRGLGLYHKSRQEIGDFTGDCGFQDSASVVTGALGEGRFVLFFPTELHKPGLVQHGCVGVRKAVVKIRMED